MRPRGSSSLRPLPSPPRLPETSLSYFLKLWDEPTSLSFHPHLCRETLQEGLLLSVCKLRVGTGSHVDTRVSPHGNMVLEASTKKLSTHHSLAVSAFAHSLPEARAIPPLSALGQLLPNFRSASGGVAFPSQAISGSASPSRGLQEKYFLHFFLLILPTC